MPERDDGCLPGDYTVTPVHSGYLIGQTLAQIGPGPWWAYVKIVSDLDAAIREGKLLASRAHTRLWLYEGGNRYERVPLDEGN